MKRIAIIGVLLSLCTSLVYSYQLSESDFSRSMMHYFETRSPDFFDDSVQFFSERKIDSGHARDIYVAFFCEFSKDEAQRDQIIAALNKNDNKNLHDFFDFVLKVDIDRFFGTQKPSSDLNDLYWACYFASGSNAYLQQIFDTAFDHLSEQKDLGLFLAATSAAWSLASNAQQFPSVTTYLKRISDDSTSRFVSEVLTRSPESYRTQAIDFIKKQRAKGIWK